MSEVHLRMERCWGEWEVDRANASMELLQEEEPHGEACMDTGGFLLGSGVIP